LNRRYFGTDGIRGIAGQPPLTAGLALRLGRALARQRPGIVVIGRDTRRSSPAIRDAVTAGLLADGAQVIDVGVLPTPAVAAEVVRRGAAAGIMITASHNPYRDNGIKVFSGDGTKLDDDAEVRLEDALERVDPDEAGEPGPWQEDHAGAARAYLDALAGWAGGGEGLRIRVDAAHGAAYPVAAAALETCGATVDAVGVAPDGANINEGVGALHPESLAAAVAAGEADLGVALDGDGDRCILVGEDGQVLDGDVAIALLARHRGDVDVVGTVMTNEGVVRHLAERGITVHRAPVGDRHVLAWLRRLGVTLGGESSGHVIQLDRGPTGDGLATALALIALRHAAGQPLCELAARIPRYPSVLRGVRVAARTPLEEVPELQDAVAVAEDRLRDRGRILLRYSGTEPLLRVFVEGEERALVEEICETLEQCARRALGDGAGE
jgi:phosphoglucosamine mutase